MDLLAHSFVCLVIMFPAFRVPLWRIQSYFQKSQVKNGASLLVLLEWHGNFISAHTILDDEDVSGAFEKGVWRGKVLEQKRKVGTMLSI